MLENQIHPRSLIGRLGRGNAKWVDAVKESPGSDVFLLVDAMRQINELTAKLAATRKHLKEANRALENKAIRLENLGRLLHQRRGDMHPKSYRGGPLTDIQLPRDCGECNYPGRFSVHAEGCPNARLSDAGRTAETLRTIGPDAIRAAAARLDGSPGVGTPPDLEKAALGVPLSPEEARRWSTFNKDLDSCDNLHQTTP